MEIIDAHYHLWRLNGPGVSWPTPDWPSLFRDFEARDFAQAVGGRVLGGVLVQSQPNSADTAWLLEQSADEPTIKAVVGWADLTAQDIGDQLAILAAWPKFRGVRPMLQAIAQVDWLLQPRLEPAFAAMRDLGLSLDALVLPRHLEVLELFAQRWPDLSIVIDHGAKPNLTSQDLGEWRQAMERLARRANVHCKLSGLRMQQARGANAEDLRPIMAELLAWFGDRLMWGSDWPMLHHTADTYEAWLNLCLSTLERVDPGSSASVFKLSAARFYRLT